jgi:HAD superfamily hydrolase (TIGR01450 family)
VEPLPVGIASLLDRHAGVLLDAYGVLVDAKGALPAAAPLIAELERRALPWAVVTNDASRSPATYEQRFAKLGLPIAAHRVVTSGGLLPGYFRDRGLAGARTCVLGTDDSRQFVREGGGIVVELAPGMAIDALAVCDDDGFPFQHGVELALSAMIHAVEAGRRPVMLLPNPDLCYPKGDGEVGITAGAMALVIETALARRFPKAGLAFVHLGKPEPHLFLEAARRLGLAADQLVMIGDTIETDIAGARAAGMASALVAGISRFDADSHIAPTYLLATIEP